MLGAFRVLCSGNSEEGRYVTPVALQWRFPETWPRPWRKLSRVTVLGAMTLLSQLVKALPAQGCRAYLGLQNV